MPLFFVMSGFFSALLLGRRGRGALVKHRFSRVFLPMLLGLVTIIPLTNGISAVALSAASSKPDGAPASKLGAAALAGDVDAVERGLTDGAKVDELVGGLGAPLLSLAALQGRTEVVNLLIDRGADVNVVARDGGSPLHAAAFLGHEKAVETLVEHGANVNAANARGETPLDVALVDEGTTRFFASLLQVKVDEEGLGGRKAAVAKYLREHGAKEGVKRSVAEQLMETPVFGHLWFLWFLWWLVLGLAAVSWLFAWSPIRLPEWLVLSPARYLWLVPLTMIPQSYMGDGGASPLFGPDTSTGLLPIPHVLAYYAIFFGFGALYFQYDDRRGRVGSRWPLTLLIAAFVVLPLGLALLPGEAGVLDLGLDPRASRALSIALQAAYPWLLTFGLMGLFRRACPVESPTMRYLSDSAYWLYLAHVPLVIAAQFAVRDWPLPALVKLALIVTVVTAFLLWTYQTLNGPRERPAPSDADVLVDAVA
jgi:hypothetical protein